MWEFLTEYLEKSLEKEIRGKKYNLKEHQEEFLEQPLGEIRRIIYREFSVKTQKKNSWKNSDNITEGFFSRNV